MSDVHLEILFEEPSVRDESQGPSLDFDLIVLIAQANVI